MNNIHETIDSGPKPNVRVFKIDDYIKVTRQKIGPVCCQSKQAVCYGRLLCVCKAQGHISVFISSQSVS